MLYYFILGFAFISAFYTYAGKAKYFMDRNNDLIFLVSPYHATNQLLVIFF